MVLRVAIAASLGLLWIGESGASLQSAYLRGDRPEVDRLAERRGAARLQADLGSKDRLKVLTAIAAASGADNSWALLGPLAARAHEPDRSIASRAAVAASRIAASVDGELLITHEVPIGPMRAVMNDWVLIAHDEERWPDVRVRALEVAASLGGALGKDAVEINWIQSISDSDPEIRRAALELAPTPISDELVETAALALTEDPSADVAGVAGFVLCDSLAERGWSDLREHLGDGAIERLRTLGSSAGQPGVVRAALAECLRAEGSSESTAVVRKIEKALPRHLRRGRR